MADSKKDDRSLEMRVAELEDKLSGMQITEEEMRAFNKVANLMGMSAQQTAAPAPADVAAYTPAPSACVVSQCVRACTVVSQCIRSCTVVSQCIRPCVINQCVRACTIVQDCINECGGGCAPGGPFAGGGGFGTLGG